MTDAPIPHFPVVHGNIYPDGSAHINFAGHDVPLTPANLNEARAQITSYAVAVARDVLHRPVRLTTVDPDGTWTLAAHPDGRVTDLAPAARPAKRSRRRRPAPAAPQPAPTAPAQPTAPAPSAARTEPVRPDPTPTSVSSVTEPAESVPVPPMPGAFTPAADAPVWVPADFPTEAEVTVFIERHQPAPSVPVLTVSFAGGDVVRITGTALVGRRPVNNTGVDLDVVRVEDPSRNLSRTHFAIAWADDVPAIVDQHSGNGTVIERGDVELVATPGVALPLQDGDRLRFGDLSADVTLSVERPEAPK
ncbi:FHA domain-containing protein [Curtobacterium sp. RHCKG23]|uniref:FHA domain-containing protein n=1 Tax=Curtobacterium citri TaxID=3055139 RepID=A0ABT7TB60_9MICO|nr:FHA domain-containing protein [Curtobacterium citri]MDM7886594.1 FHA domain-containing protein [Curtobacterium citri]